MFQEAVELVKESYLKFFSMQDALNAAVSFAALVSDEFVDGLGMQLGGDADNWVWRGDPRTLVIMAYILVLFRLLEDLLCQRGAEDTGVHTQFGWWCDGFAGLELATIEGHLAAVDLAEARAIQGSSRAIEGQPVAVELKVNGYSMRAMQVGRWRKWIEWPLGMVQKRR